MANSSASSHGESSEPLLTSTSRDDSHGPLKSPSPRSASLPILIFYFMAIHFLLAFCELILVAPLIKLFENSICMRHFGFPETLDPESCQIIEVQRRLAEIRGWKSMFDVVPVLLVTIPCGKLGDRYGRKKIIAIALFGVIGSLTEIFIVCAFPKDFPLQFVWFSSILLLCGGGLNSASAYMWGMASECIPSSKRSHGFYYIFSAFYVAEMVASFIATLTTDVSPWIACGLSMASAFLCLLLLAIMPASKSTNEEDSSSITAAERGNRLQNGSTFLTAFDRIIKAASNRNIILTVPVILVGILRYTTLGILIQYAHFRFKQKISIGAAYYTETAIINIALFLFLIPQATAYLRKEYRIRPQAIDLFLARASVTCMCIGALAIGLAPTNKLLPVGVFIFAAGFGSRVSAIALVSYWVSDDAKPTIYAAITVFESLGHAFIDPSMQQIFAAALDLPQFWLAMPFFVAAGLYFLAMLSTLFIRIDKTQNTEDSLHRD